jgi:Flp pilus assembly protein TadG
MKPVRVRRQERGTGLVELALCVPVFAALLFGVMMGSMLLFSYHSLSELAREGTRYAIVRGSQCGSFTPTVSACPAANSDIQSYVQGLAVAPLKSSSVTVATKWNGSTTPTNNNSPGNTVSVQVSYPFSLTIPFVPSHSFTISSTSAMVISE